MDSSLINNINNRNVQNIRYQINNKKRSNVYYSTENTNRNVITDYDTFPYTRWFRGEAESESPIVAEREAGWRPRNENCYDTVKPIKTEKQKKHSDIKPRHYYQPACSIVYPKYVSESDISLTDVKLNENCVISYR